MIKLYQFPSPWNLPNASPFCMKLETYLRMAQLPYEVVATHDPRKAPKGKLPYIKDGDKAIGDSHLIINYLQKTYGVQLDRHLTAEQLAIAATTQCLLEEHLYWILFYSRWFDSNFWPTIKKAYFSNLPFLIRDYLPELIRKQCRKALFNQGLGRHTPAEIYEFGKRDIQTIATLLGEKNFFFGDEPSSIDASVYAFIANFLVPPLETPLKLYAKTFPNLNQYCDRMKQRFYA